MQSEKDISNYVFSPVLGDKPGRDLYVVDNPVGHSDHGLKDHWHENEDSKMNEKAENALNKERDEDNLWSKGQTFTEVIPSGKIQQREEIICYPENESSKAAHLTVHVISNYDPSSGDHSVDRHAHFTVQDDEGKKHSIGINDPNAVQFVEHYNSRVDTSAFERVHKAQNEGND